MNTSGEANKNGIEPTDVVETVKHIVTSCSNLKFCGLMTIGDLGNSIAANTEVRHEWFESFSFDRLFLQGGNPDFLKLRESRKRIAEDLNMKESDIELSMGMSKDFEEAIRMGSTNGRVGSSIFGGRSYPAKEPVNESDGVGELTKQLDKQAL